MGCMKKSHFSDTPFPLQSRYNTRILPGIVLFMVVLVGLTAFGAFKATRHYYLQVAAQRAASVASFIQHTSPDAWDEMLRGELTVQSPSIGVLDADLRSVLPSVGIEMVKIYNLGRRVIYASDTSKIGEFEDNETIYEVLATEASSLNSEKMLNGVRAYELYAPVFDAYGNMLAIFEIYEPEQKMNEVMLLSTALPAGISLCLFLLLLLVLTRLIHRAQKDIDYRTDAMVALRRRLETFLPQAAVDAAKSVDSSTPIASKLLHCSILYLDVRDFTSFSEENRPEDVVTFLNSVFEIVIEAIHEQGGEVDKFIGDAVMAWFRGDDAPRRAIRAAMAILGALPADMPRRLGLGIYTGPVVAGALGPEVRRDFTIIGNSVNMAARLCSAAGKDEILIDAQTADAAGADAKAFGPVERIKVKGIDTPLSVRRFGMRPSGN